MTRERPAGSSYAAAGVDIDAAERLVTRFAELARGARRPEVLADVGPFSGLFRLGSYRDPVLVASTDSVGTKVKLAVLLERYEGLGHDLVNHCVNDALTAGAEPLFFLDYIGGSGVTDEAKLALVGGVAAACREAGCALLGGETADMPGLYASGDFDLVGFIVGVVERDAVIDGSRIREGDALLGLPSNGLHTNGYSLVRKLFGVGMDSGCGGGAGAAGAGLPGAGRRHPGRGAAGAAPLLLRRAEAAAEGRALRRSAPTGHRPHHRRRHPRQRPAHPAGRSRRPHRPQRPGRRRRCSG